MAKRAVLIVAFAIVLILTVGCGTPTPVPTAVLQPTIPPPPPTDTPPLPPTAPAPTDTPQPSATATPVPTDTPLPSATATPVPPAESSPEGARITFVNNAGFLITAGGRKILIDALHNENPRGILIAVVDARPPFDAIDLILATHEHQDHFSPELVARAMSQNPGAVFVSSRRAVEQLLAVDDSLQDRAIPIQLQAGESEQLDVNGILLEALYISHGMPNLLNLGFVITVGDVRIFHTGDSTADDITVSYLQSYGLPEMHLDVAFVPYFYLTRERYHAYALEGIQARYLIPMHYDYRNPPLGVEADFPNAVVFHDTLESWELPLAAETTPLPPTRTPQPTSRPPLSGNGGGVIAFVANWDIYLMNADGTGVRRLVTHRSRDAWPTWSPDGRQIAFMSEREGRWSVFVMDVDQGESSVRRLTSSGTTWEPAWSPDGAWIAFGSPRSGNSDIYVMDVSTPGGSERRLTDHSQVDGYPCWSPDSTQIAFVSDRDGNWEIYVMAVPEGTDADGTDVRRLTVNHADDWDPDWSPDGARIAFASRRDGNMEIYVVNADGSDLRRLTDHPADDLNPSWSPDGTQIAFHREEGGKTDLYLMSADGSDPHKLTARSNDGSNPVWRPDPAALPAYAPLYERAGCQFPVH